MGEPCKFEREIIQIGKDIAVAKEKIINFANFAEATTAYRIKREDKEEKRNDIMMSEISEIKAMALLSTQYIAEAKKKKSIWSDRGFQFFILLITFILGIFGWWIKSEAKIEQRIVDGNAPRPYAGTITDTIRLQE